MKKEKHVYAAFVALIRVTSLSNCNHDTSVIIVIFQNNGEKNHPDKNDSRSYFGEAMFDSIYLNNI